MNAITQGELKAVLGLSRRLRKSPLPMLEEVVSTRLPCRAADRLRALAAADDRSISQYARRVLLNHLGFGLDDEPVS
jgi:hypothetical protein